MQYEIVSAGEDVDDERARGRRAAAPAAPSSAVPSSAALSSAALSSAAQPTGAPPATAAARRGRDLPRERLLARGPAALSDAELVALLLGSGLPGHDVFALAHTLLARFGSLRALLDAAPEISRACAASAPRAPRSSSRSSSSRGARSPRRPASGRSSIRRARSTTICGC
ncbi:putative dNA repair protein RadC [Burkholderia pseudomallei MSHR435]|nr:putative dNA repair protein RadC [Burkholderia pseudomallei MSHR435]